MKHEYDFRTTHSRTLVHFYIQQALINHNKALAKHKKEIKQSVFIDDVVQKSYTFHKNCNFQLLLQRPRNRTFQIKTVPKIQIQVELSKMKTFSVEVFETVFLKHHLVLM